MTKYCVPNSRCQTLTSDVRYRYSLKILPDSRRHTGVLPNSGEELEGDHPEHEGCHEHAQRHNQLKNFDLSEKHQGYFHQLLLLAHHVRFYFRCTYSSVQGANPLYGPGSDSSFLEI